MLKERSVLLDELLFLFWDIFQGMNRVGGTSGNASTAIDAALGIYVHLSRGFELGLVLLGVDAVGRANLDTERVFDAGISNHIGHDESISTMK
jgi:hypothetical protein